MLSLITNSYYTQENASVDNTDNERDIQTPDEKTALWVEKETLFYSEQTEQTGQTILHKEFTWHNDPDPQHAPHFGLSFTTQNSPTPTTWFLAPDSSKHRIKITTEPTYPFTKQEPSTVGWTMLQPAITG